VASLREMEDRVLPQLPRDVFEPEPEVEPARIKRRRL